MKEYKIGLPENIKDEDCEKELTAIYRTINRAMKGSIPKSKPRTVDKNNPWWTAELKQERNNVSKLYKLQNKSPSAANIDKYKKAHKKYKANCLRAPTNSWRNFQSEVDSIQTMNMYRKIIEGNKKVTLGTLTKNDGSVTNPGAETIEYLLSAHFKNSSPIAETANSKRTVSKKEVEKGECNWINEEKVEAVFDNFKNKKSPGKDNISPIVLKHLPRKFITQLVFLYKTLVMLHFTPTKWKECKLVFIPKTGKETYKDPKAWRAISFNKLPVQNTRKISMLAHR